MASKSKYRKDFALDFITNASFYPESDKLTNALLRFLTKVDDDVFDKLNDRAIVIIDGSLQAAMVEHYPNSDDFRNGFDIVFFSDAHIKDTTQQALVGIVAHEFAHVIAGHADRGRKRVPAFEHEADEIAVSWGFAKEIDVKNDYTRKSIEKAKRSAE